MKPMIVLVMLNHAGSELDDVWIGIIQDGLGILLPSPIFAIDHIHPIWQGRACGKKRPIEIAIGMRQVVH
jgi:hypothetical protein